MTPVEQTRLLTGLALCLAAQSLAASSASDWPQFLGPDRNATVENAKGLAKSWPMEGPRVLWEKPLGRGFGGASVYGDSVFVLDRDDSAGAAKDMVLRLKLSDGQEVWRFEHEAAGKYSVPGARCTPATDGKLVFAIGPFGQFYALKAADGKLAWQAHLLDDWDGTLPKNWAVSTSPLLTSKYVVVSPWGKKAALVAYTKTSGKVRWKTPNTSDAVLDYTSPVPMKLGRKRTIVAVGKDGRTSYTMGVDERTGARLWEYDGYGCSIQIPSPVVLGKGVIMLTGGYKAGSVMIQVTRRGGGYHVQELWRDREIGSTLAQPVLHKGHIYLNKGFKSEAQGLLCMTPDHDLKWDTGEAPSFDRGPILLVGDLLYAVDGKGGDLVMVDPSPKGYEELARAKVLRGPQAWAPMAYSNGRLLVRDQRKLVCVDVTAAK